jgi:hypothetical protein
MRSMHRERLQVAVRVTLVALVVAWLFSESLRARLPVWLPLLTLAVFEAEFVARAWW